MKTETSHTSFKELFGRGLKAEGQRLIAEFFIGFGSTSIPSERVKEEVGKVNSIDQAEYVVRAVNNHEALLEALKRADTHLRLTIGLVSNRTREEKELLQMMHLAIAQAESEGRP